MAITDIESAKEWLESVPHDARVAFAARCALRSLPGLGMAETATLSGIALPFLRAMLTSGVASEMPTPEVRKAASAAYSATATADSAYSATYSATAAADSAASAANSAYSAASAANSAYSAASATAYSATATATDYSATASVAYSAANTDAERISENGLDAAFNAPLWPDADTPDFFVSPSQNLQTFWNENPQIWGFWARWYDSMFKGEPMDWALQEAVALIPNKIWEDGAGAVADEIAKIEGAWIKARAATQETLILDQSTQLFSAIQPKASNDERLARHLSRVEDALSDVIALGGNNGLTTSTSEHRIVSRLVEKYSDDPERIAFDLRDVNRSIARQIESQEYADTEQIKLLQSASTACISAICSMEPEIAAELDVTFDRDPEIPDQPDVLLLEEAFRVSAEMLDTAARETTIEDLSELFHGEVIHAAKDGELDRAIQLAKNYRASVIRRQINRMAQQAAELESWDKLAEHYDSKYSKSAGVAVRYGGVAGALWWAVRKLGGMIGIG